ncbi:MAG: hypothetical protein J6386_11590 [Candidatus Synoicihabitans palmerolidicus]|nr:hypothetical protein [Candidatus Synoicihabitans palmerolidicus]
MLLINETNVFRCVPMPTELAILVQIVEAALHDSSLIEKLFAAETENLHLRPKLVAAETRRPAALTREWLRAMPCLATIVVCTFAGTFRHGRAHPRLTILSQDLSRHRHLRRRPLERRHALVLLS